MDGQSQSPNPLVISYRKLMTSTVTSTDNQSSQSNLTVSRARDGAVKLSVIIVNSFHFEIPSKTGLLLFAEFSGRKESPYWFFYNGLEERCGSNAS